MKDNLENNIKQSLENHEMPYNASAWTAMQAKLDVAKPVASPASNLKWYISAASVVAIGIVAYVALNNSTEVVKETPKQADKVDIVETNTNSTTDNNTVKTKTAPTSTASTNNDEKTEDLTSLQRTNSTVSNPVQRNPFGANNTGGNGTIGNGNTDSDNSTGNSNGNSTSTATTKNPTKTFSLPIMTDICEGETASIKNSNDVALRIVGPSSEYIIPANSEKKVKLTKEGMHEISVITEGNVKKSATFFVKRAPKADFIIDTDTKFEKGLPTTKLETSVPGVEHAWKIGNSKVYGEKVDAHFYKSGDHTITLTVKDASGCANSVSKSIHIDEKYNLMAVNSFIPEDIDNRNNTFMPFALTQRDVKFNLIVIDPTDGHIVFQSNDASNAWNGIDKTTGNGASYGMTYIWKVTIENPEPNENNEYAGNITPIQKR